MGSRTEGRLSCGSKTIKFLLFIFNFLFVLTGIGIIVTGSLVLTKFKNFDAVFEGQFLAPPIVLIVSGSLIFVISFFGCCGALKKNRCMLLTFAGCILAVFIIQFIIGIDVLVNYDTEKVYFKRLLGKQLKNRPFYDKLERELHCCGVIGKVDYFGNEPASCCTKYATGCNTTLTSDPLQYWREGCAVALTEWVKLNGAIIGGVALGLAVFEVLEGIFAIILARSLRAEYQWKN